MTTDPALPGATASPPPPRIFLRPLATPLPLGFLGLAVATFVLSGLQLGWVPVGQAHQVALVMVAFAFPAQLIAALYGFLCRDAAAATGMGVLAGTWLTLGLITLGSPPGATSETAGLLLLAAGLVLFVPAVATVPSKGVAGVVLFTAALRFLLTGAYQYGGGSSWKTAAGVTGAVLAAFALYAALALELEGQRRRTVLPTLRRGGSTGAAPGTAVQDEALGREPGVRGEL
ncbi:GPR1/FUN34/YaaH family transporter [Kitasatospora sp. A2-31]|uniref:GPR1/FUN34/YaaH family transporter n=1 Tax=Kitasatospora sp. A2-31 TaxID=2916414 RepID=UPI001EEA44EB|nr:GPR1/FUN34/YaaH family transporter [Kitasatospora sp. A2-31]MCG6497771.1 GPR1/FUN34/YaaH family transporter [Kitasatospora sp. A2-31]